jgi:hypothetical protein
MKPESSFVAACGDYAMETAHEGQAICSLLYVKIQKLYFKVLKNLK